MKLTSMFLAAAAVLIAGVSAAQAEPTIRDHRHVDPSTCPGGITVGGQCTNPVKPRRCPKSPYKCY